MQMRGREGTTELDPGGLRGRVAACRDLNHGKHAHATSYVQQLQSSENICSSFLAVEGGWPSGVLRSAQDLDKEVDQKSEV